MSKQPRGLGKGLGALLGNTSLTDPQQRPAVGYINKEVGGQSQAKPDAAGILNVPAEYIEANPYQPRSAFDQDALEELAASIRSLGLIQPVTVRKLSSTRYQIISGERRFRACRMAGMNFIPAYVREASDQGMLEMAIVENIQRYDLDPIETAMSYQRLIEECSLTQEEMAERLGKKRSSVTNFLRLLKLPAKVQYDLKMGLLSVGHAKAILAIEDPAVQEKLCNLVITDALSVRQLEALVRKVSLGADVPVKKKEQKSVELPETYTRVSSIMGEWFTGGVSVKRGASGKGTMTLKFTSDEEVSAFLKAIESIGK